MRLVTTVRHYTSLRTFILTTTSSRRVRAGLSLSAFTQKRKMGVLENFEILSNCHSSACTSSQSINNEDGSDTNSTESDDQIMDLTVIQPIANVTEQQLSSSNQHMEEVAKINYENVVINIFTDNRTDPRRFFFMPLVQLDPTTISIESSSDKFIKEKFVCFKIIMWTEDLRSMVLDHLRSLPNLSNSSKIQLDDISVMPYEDIKLIKKSDYVINNESIRLAKKSTSYERLSDSVPFYFRCDSMDSARFLADNLRQHPDFLLEKCKLGLECQGLALASRSNPPDRRRATFEVSSLPLKKIEDMKPLPLPPSLKKAGELIHMFSDVMDWLIKGLYLIILVSFLYQSREQLTTKTSNKETRNSTNVVPVFSVKNFIGSNATNQQYIPFSTSEFNTETKHGDFDLASGIFTVKTAGIYQLNFNGHVRLWYIRTHHFELQVNGKRKAVSYTSSYSSEGYHQIDLSSLLHLYIGDKVGVFQIEGQLRGQPESDFVSTFSGILFPHKY